MFFRRRKNEFVTRGSADSASGSNRGAEVSCARGTTTARDPRLFGLDAKSKRHLIDFLVRVLSVDDVESIVVDRANASVSIGFDPERVDAVEHLAKLAGAVEDRISPAASPRDRALVERLVDESQHKFILNRYSNYLTTWEIVHATRDRVRLRDDRLIGDRALCERLERGLWGSHGVRSATAKSLTGNVIVRFDRSATNVDKILRDLDAALWGSTVAAEADGAHLARVGFSTANVSLVAAAITDFFVPLLWPAAAGLLILCNKSAIKAAGRQLRERKLGVAVLYTVIVAATVVSGQFLAAALMSWLFRFWRRAYRDRLIETSRTLLPELSRRSRHALLRVGGSLIEVHIDSIEPGDELLVQEGETIPIDGVVLEGSATIDERLVLGTREPGEKSVGESVYAGSVVARGELTIVASADRASSRGEVLRKTMTNAAIPGNRSLESSISPHGEAFADRFIAPTFAVAGLGLLVGDVSTAVAIMRADYATGPGIGVSLDLLHDVANSARRGVLIRESSFLRRLAAVDFVVLDRNDKYFENTGVNSSEIIKSEDSLIAFLRSRGVSIGVIAATFDPADERRYAELGVSFTTRVDSATDRVELIRKLSAEAKKVCYIGDCSRYQSITNAAFVTISLSGEIDTTRNPADALLIRPELDAIEPLWTTASDHVERARGVARSTVIPNVLCLTGVFLFGLTSLATVVVSNLGTLAIYANTKKRNSERNRPRSIASSV